MRILSLFLLVCWLALTSAVHAQERFDELAKRVPFLSERLHSGRWQVRYCLLRELDGRDDESKRALEMLVRDKHKKVANQALVGYVSNFVNIDKSLFDPEIYVPNRYPVTDLPQDNPHRALVDYLLGKKDVPLRGEAYPQDVPREVPVLAVGGKDEAAMGPSLTIVGILGNAKDANALYPFLDSTNDYVLLAAAKALIRLGDKAKAVEALSRLTEKDVREHLPYITEALYVLREINHTEFEEMVLRVLSEVDKQDRIQPNWLNGFLLLAAEVKDDVW